jgi:hypothetical protein
MKKAKLLYIVSSGHSGSTLLDLICGTIPTVFSMGEMHFFSWQLKQGEIKDDPQTYCSCGKYFDQCSFWLPILNSLSEEKGVDIFNCPAKINFSLNKGIVRHRKYYKHVVLNKLLTYSYKYPILLGGARKIVYTAYKQGIKNTWSLYDKVAQQSNTEYVVDSSKNIHRALLLKMFRPNDVKILVLKRNVHGVASSSHIELTKEVIKERVDQWIKLYRKRLPVYLKNLECDEYREIKYEKMCSNYNDLRIEIADFLGINTAKIKPINYIYPHKYHTVQGNPMRLKKDAVEIKYDERWKSRLSEEQVLWIKRRLK